jgi:UDP-N-acetylmuramoyl-L-alanyl-D-glutamate--2,6-diaminopimelate ligase
MRPDEVPGRSLGELAERLRVRLPAGADAGARLTGVALDSRQVQPGDVYAALPGQHVHGAGFVAQAAASGAVAVITDADGEQDAARAGLPVLVVPDPRSRLGEVASWLYGDPATELLLLGVTGTNGKTTTTYLLDAALRAAGHVTGLVGTVETRIADQHVPSVRTTPEAPDVHALLAVMRERSVTACAMEVSSHALALHRVDGVRFDVAGFTNLSQDHLDFHGTLEDYFAAKASLFTPARADRGVVCVDDEWGRRLAATAAIPVVTVGTGEPSSSPGDQSEPDWRVVGRHLEEGGRTSFTLRSAAGLALRMTSPLPGNFNVANTALALVMLMEAGLDAHAAVLGLAMSDGVPGRMERVVVPGGRGPLAVVDYAHTPDAVSAALTALRPATTGRLVIVLGAGGERDPGKRPAMGAAAARTADVVVVTDDNPRSEPPDRIRAAVLSGAQDAARSSGAQVLEVAGRREAVLAAVRAASTPGDTVLVAGKGHEQGQEVAGQVHPFDDREVLRRAIEQVVS